MDSTPAKGRQRRSLDDLVTRMREPGFEVRYRRVPPSVETSGHVSAALLAVAPPRSRFVRRWRRHARRCPTCANTFRYLGLSLD
jgi:hypothetical protein